LNDKLLWWMSLNSTEKKNKTYISKLVVDTENLIIEESKQWSASSGSSSKSDVEGKEDNENKDNNSEIKNANNK